MGKALQMDTSGLLSFGATNPAWISNLGIKYGADSTTGRLKITAADGTNLSSTNKGWLTMPSATTAGTFARIKVDYTTHVHYFEDDAATTSDIAGEEFGVATGVAWGNDRPFFIYAVNSADTAAGLAFAISPNPTATASPATANSGYHGTPAATPSDLNFFYLTSTDVTVTHAAKPCMLIGVIRMRMSASDDWTVQTLGDTDGIGHDALYKAFSTRWTMPLAQNGAATGTYFHTNSGTAPVFTKNQYIYQIDMMGDVRIDTYLASDGGTDGASGNQARVSLPYGWVSGTLDLNLFPVGFVIAATTITASQVCYGLITEGTNWVDLYYADAAAALQIVTLGMFTNGSRQLTLHFAYNPFKN